MSSKRGASVRCWGLRRVGYRILAFLALGLTSFAAMAWAEVPVARQRELDSLLRQDCGSCHGLTLKGGLGLPLTPEALSGRSNNELEEIILHGVPGTPMPPWESLLSREETQWIVRNIRQGDNR